MMRTLIVALAISAVAFTGWLFEPRLERVLTEVKAHLNEPVAAPEAVPEVAPEAAPESAPAATETKTSSAPQAVEAPVAAVAVGRWF
jgi:hypothetical protein